MTALPTENPGQSRGAKSRCSAIVGQRILPTTTPYGNVTQNPSDNTGNTQTSLHPKPSGSVGM